jgi:hypothetical protein
MIRWRMADGGFNHSTIRHPPSAIRNHFVLAIQYLVLQSAISYKMVRISNYQT